MEEERKKLLFVFVFSTYLPVFLLKFRSRELVGCGIWFRIQQVPTLHTFDRPRYPKNKKYLKKRDDDTNEYPHCILLTDPATPKTRNTWKNVMMMWVLVGCRIKFRIQRALSIKICVKAQGDMSKIQIKKVDFFFLPPKLINIIFFILTIIFLFSLGGPF